MSSSVRRCAGSVVTALLAAPLVFVLPAAAAPPSAAPAPLPAYELVDLGVLPGAAWQSRATGVNDAGQVVGYSTNGLDQTHAFRWQAGVLTDLNGDAVWSSATAVNESGAVSGTFGVPADRESRAAVWSPTGVRTETGLLPAEEEGHLPSAEAADLNDDGLVVGHVVTSRDYVHATVFDGQLHDLGIGVGPYDWQSHLNAVNSAGEAVGYVTGSDGTRALYYRDGVKTTIAELNRAADISDSGVIVGQGRYGGGQKWEQGRLTPLHGLSDSGYPAAINSAGDVVGATATHTGAPVPVLWRNGSSTPLDLNTVLPAGSGWRLMHVSDINDRGWIVGYGVKDAKGRAVLLKPVGDEPEQPSLQLGQVRLEHRDVPSNAWVPVPDTGTIDGNVVRVTAQVTNPGTRALTARLEPRLGAEPLDARPLDTAVPAGATVPLSFDWDTSGRAWGPDQTPTIVHTLQLALSSVEGSTAQPADDATVTTRVRPRPAVLVHGFNADHTTWEGYATIMRAHNPTWPVFAVGDGQAPGAMDTGSLSTPDTPANTLVENAMIMDGYVETVRDLTDAQHVDLVAHSMGGLISRQYVETGMGTAADGRNVAHRLVMLGTPNHGSPCASLMRLFAMWELRPEVVEEYNTRLVNAPGVPMSVLAGDPLDVTCSQRAPGDGVVAVESAVTGFTDTRLSLSVHTGLTGQADFEQFVLPRLAQTVGAAAAPLRAAEVVEPPAPAPAPQLLAEQVVTVPPSGSADVEVPVSAVGALGATWLGAAGLGADLLGPGGAVAATVDGGSPEAAQAFASLAAAGPADGAWTLRLRNATSAQRSVPVALWVDGGPVSLHLATALDPAGRVTVTGRLTRDGAPVAGAAMTAVLEAPDGEDVELVLAPGADGALSATSGRVQPGQHFVRLSAVAPGGLTRTTVGAVVVPEVTDVEPPVLAVPDRVAVVATSATGADVTWTATASDAVDPTPAVTCSPAPGRFPVGTTPVTCTATDLAGNAATGRFDVVVSPQAPPVTVGSVLAELRTALTSAPANVREPLGARLATVESSHAKGQRDKACKHLDDADRLLAQRTAKGLDAGLARRLAAGLSRLDQLLRC